MTGFYLDVPFVSQLDYGNPKDPTSDPTGCWYASCCMIGYYFEAGPRLGLPQLYSRQIGTRADGSPVVGHWPIAKGWVPYWLKNEHLTVVPGPASKQWNLHKLADLLKQYGPMAFPWSKTANGSTYGHCSVLIGVDFTKREAIFHDPELAPRSRLGIDAFNKALLWGFESGMWRREGPAFQQRNVVAL